MPERVPERTRAGQANSIHKYTNIHCGRWPTLLRRLPSLSLFTAFSLCLCACWYIKAMSCCCCSCTWQLNLHMATVGSRKTHVITLPQLNGVDLLIMHKFTLLSHLSLALLSNYTYIYATSCLAPYIFMSKFKIKAKQTKAIRCRNLNWKPTLVLKFLEPLSSVSPSHPHLSLCLLYEYMNIIHLFALDFQKHSPNEYL